MSIYKETENGLELISSDGPQAIPVEVTSIIEEAGLQVPSCEEVAVALAVELEKNK